jgi:toxin ParE1/3/4
MTRVSFHELAERELNDAALYYEQENAGLGIKFIDEIERYIGAIIKNPNAGKKVRGQVRRRILRTFPYGILYSVKDDGIRVLAIMNLKRRPLYWVGRS